MSKFESQKELKEHFRVVHPAVKCDLCQEYFDTPAAMLHHKYKHYDYMYECKICDKGFQFESQHMRVHQSQGDWVCFKPKCGKHFKRESKLNAHLFAHNKVPQKCEHCPYTNSDPRNLCENTVMCYLLNVVNVVKVLSGSNSAFNILTQQNVQNQIIKHFCFVVRRLYLCKRQNKLCTYF